MAEDTAARARNRRGEGGRLRAALVEGTRRLLAAAPGGETFSLRAAAREAGVAAPSVYRHFPDRDRLLLAALETLFDELDGLGEVAERDAGGTAWQRLLAVCVVPVRFALARPGHYAALAGSGMVAAAGPDAFGTPLLGRMTTLLREILAAGGRMEDPERLALLLWLAIHGVVSQRIARPGTAGPDPEELVRQLARRLVRPDG